MSRTWGGLSFHITQLLTGHGCFGIYLKRIGKAESSLCPFCNSEDDSADHTIRVCPEWQNDRDDLISVIGPDLSLSGVIRGIIGSRESWTAFAKFAEAVMLKKEEAERAKDSLFTRTGPRKIRARCLLSGQLVLIIYFYLFIYYLLLILSYWPFSWCSIVWFIRGCVQLLGYSLAVSIFKCGTGYYLSYMYMCRSPFYLLRFSIYIFTFNYLFIYLTYLFI